MSSNTTVPPQLTVVEGSTEGFSCIPNSVGVPSIGSTPNASTHLPGVYDPPLTISPSDTRLTVSDASVPKAADISQQSYMSENVTMPDPIVISRTLDYLRMCDSEYRSGIRASVEQKRALAEKDAKISELTEANEKLRAKVEELTQQNKTITDEYNTLMSDNAVKDKKSQEDFAKLTADYQTLQNHFAIIANGFNSLNTLIAQQSGK
jgi:ribosomal protein S15P/S13E